MLQEQKLEDFFNWLLDCRFFPKPCGNPQRFLPRIDREIQCLKKLEQEGCPAIKFAIENLETARSSIARMGYEFRSKFMTIAGGQDKRNIESAWRLVAATCVAVALWPDVSPHRRVWEKLESNGYVSSQNISERTLEMRVRRFDAARQGSLGFVLLAEYQNFKCFSTSTDTVKALQAGWRSKDRRRLCRLQTVSKREIRMLEKLGANYEAYKDGTART